MGKGGERRGVEREEEGREKKTRGERTSEVGRSLQKLSSECTGREEQTREEAGGTRRRWVLTCFRGGIRSGDTRHRIGIPVFPGPERTQLGLDGTLGQEEVREEDIHMLA